MRDLEYKIPVENNSYPAWSEYALNQMAAILTARLERGQNKIFIRTNLKRGLPLENINKVAGPFVEAWAHEVFEEINDDPENPYCLIHVEPGARLDPYDLILQFKKRDEESPAITAHVDSKATAEDIPNAGKSPNITSYKRIRSSYVEDPDYLFVILSLKHKVYAEKSGDLGITNGIMEVTSFASYDIKYLSEKDISYNPALGTGQIQIRDIHYVTFAKRSAWEFCQVLDRKFVLSKGEEAFVKMAKKQGWVK